MNRLSYTRKFAVLGLLSVAASTVVAYNLFVSLDREIHKSRRELAGLALVRPLSRTLQLIQQCRGLSAALIGGDKSVHQALIAKEVEADESFKTLEASLPIMLTSRKDWRSIKEDWEHLHEDGLNWTVTENFTAHTRLIEQLMDFEAISGDEYILNLSSESGAFYLIDTAINKLPHALEHLGQIRAYGTGILTRKQVDEHQKANLNTLIVELSDAIKHLRINLEKTGRYNPAMQESLLAASKDITDSSQQIIDLVKSDILTGHLTVPPADFLMTTTAAIDRGYTQLYDSLLPAAETIAKVRLAKAENALRISIGISLLVALVVTYFAVGIYYSIIDSVRSLSRSAHAFAGGDMRERVDLGTHDELKQIGDSFNEMADGFSALLAGHKRAEELLAKENYKNETLLRTASDSIYIFDINGNVVQVNDAFCRMLGYTKEEMLTMNVAHWNAQWSVAELKEILANLQFSNPVFETVHRRRDGSMINVEISAAKVEIDGRQLIYNAARDITERKQAEGALRKSKGLLQSIVENTPVCVFWKDRDSRYLGCNTPFAKDAGCSSPDELIGKTDFDMGWRDQAEMYRADDKAVMESGIPKLGYEEPLTTPGGKVIWVRTSKVPLRDINHEVIGILGIYEDITERKLAKEELLASKNRLEEAQRIAHVGNWEWNIQTNEVLFSDEACRIFGMEPRTSGITFQSVFNLIHPADQEMVQQAVNAAVSHLQGLNLEHRIILADGEVRTVYELGQARLDPHGMPECIAGTVQDITARKHAENALQKNAELYRQLVEASMDGYLMCNTDCRLLDVNDTYAHKSGYTRGELLDMRIADLEAQMDAAEITNKIQGLMQVGQARFETAHRSKDGTIWPLEVSMAFLPQDGGRFFCFMRDITERKKVEQELRERGEEMEQLLKQQVATQTAAAIAHELNQPLLAIAACSDAALHMFESGGIDKEQLSRSLVLNKEQAIRAGESLRHLFSILHDQPPATEVFDLNLQLQDFLGMFRKKYAPQFREVRKLERKLPPVRASHLHVQIVMTNLLRNGMEAIQAASIPAPELTVLTAKDGNMARVTILDNGPGLQAQDIERIFETFYTTKPTGIGMGLKISRSLIKANGGELWAESTPGRGAAFHFTLPLAL